MSLILFVGVASNVNAITPRCLAAIKSALTNIHEPESFFTTFQVRAALEALKKEMEEKVKSMSDSELEAQLDTWIRNTIAFRTQSDSEGFLPGQQPDTRTRTLAELLEAERTQRAAISNIIGNLGTVAIETGADVLIGGEVRDASEMYNNYKKNVFPSKMLEELHRRIHKDNYPEVYNRMAAENYFNKVKGKMEADIGILSNEKLISEVSMYHYDAIKLAREELTNPGSLQQRIEKFSAYEVESNPAKFFASGRVTVVDALNGLRQYEASAYKMKLLIEFKRRIEAALIRF